MRILTPLIFSALCRATWCAISGGNGGYEENGSDVIGEEKLGSREHEKADGETKPTVTEDGSESIFAFADRKDASKDEDLATLSDGMRKEKV